MGQCLSQVAQHGEDLVAFVDRLGADSRRSKRFAVRVVSGG
jgi:hypothetical protein